MKPKRVISILAGLILLFCLLGVMSLLQIGSSTMKQVPVPTQDQIFGDGTVPPSGSCADIGKDFDDDPFYGWPVQYRPGDWNTISAWFCDPTYTNKSGKVVMHSGVDIATYWCEVGECQTVSIEWATVVVTTAKAIVREVKKDCPALSQAEVGTNAQKCGYPMGNHVILEALKEEKICTIDPVTRVPECDITWIPSGWKVTYMHLNKVENLVVDQELIYGKKIGEVGTTGNSGGFHLHYQINMPRDGYKAVDPAPTLSKSYNDIIRRLGPHFRPYGP